MVTQWVPLYESNVDTVKSELATFFDVFPHATIWSNDNQGKGYDVVVLGPTEATTINVDDLEKRRASPDHFLVRLSMMEVIFWSAEDLLATYGGQACDLAPWLEGAEINRDRNLRLQYLAGMGLNLYESRDIYDEMLRYRRFPDELFAGSSKSIAALKRAIEQPGKKPQKKPQTKP
jgi:spermidine synthase